MSRHYVGYTARGATTSRNIRTEDGYPLLLMETGETRKVTLDFSSLLETGESISSATASGQGVTTSAAVASPTITLTLSSPTAWGEVTITVTLSSGEVIVETLRARISNRAFDPAEVAYAL